MQQSSESTRQLPETVRIAAGVVIDYLWDEELKNFLDHHGYEQTMDHIGGHVFAALCELRSYFEGRRHDPKSYLAKASNPARPDEVITNDRKNHNSE